jgi:hypothetical protein
MIGREMNRVEPELARLVVPFDMHMHRLTAIEAVKVKSIRARKVPDRGHDLTGVSPFREPKPSVQVIAHAVPPNALGGPKTCRQLEVRDPLSEQNPDARKNTWREGWCARQVSNLRPPV